MEPTFVEFCKNGDVAAVKQAITDKTLGNLGDALRVACNYNQLDIARVLIDNGAPGAPTLDERC